MTRWTWHDTAFLLAIIGLTVTGVVVLAFALEAMVRPAREWA
jgi:hypothetical protein